MLSTEARPVEMIFTNEQGLPRWVMCNWKNRRPEKVLLLNPDVPTTNPDQGYRLALIYEMGEACTVLVAAGLLDEIPPD
jgi:hypothetical protein